MKLTAISKDDKLHAYCMRCRQEFAYTKSQPSYRCSSCNHVDTRALIIDPSVNWWLDRSGEYWHETGGIFVRNSEGQFLFFDRTKHPFGLTVPAGHVDRSEQPSRTARRELSEETGIRLPQRAFTHVVTSNIVGDECRRGADAHRWHVYATKMPALATVKVDASEGTSPVWLDLNQALQQNLTFAVRRLIAQYGPRIERALG
jgi:8-oxo-dGTP pyrophosphatase MutT (NUDIX family)